MTNPKTTASLTGSQAKTTTSLHDPTKPAIDRCASDTVEGVYLSDLCDALAKHGYRIRAIALAHNWAAFRLAVNAAKRWLPEDVRQKITRR